MNHVFFPYWFHVDKQDQQRSGAKCIKRSPFLPGRYQKARASIASCNFTGPKEFPALSKMLLQKNFGYVACFPSFRQRCCRFSFILSICLGGSAPATSSTTTTMTAAETCFRDQSYSYYNSDEAAEIGWNVTKGEIRGKAKGLPTFTEGGGGTLCAIKRKVFELSTHATFWGNYDVP